MTQTHELSEICFQTNYYGAKRMCEAFIPLLQSSDSPKLINVSSTLGMLKVTTLLIQVLSMMFLICDIA